MTIEKECAQTFLLHTFTKRFIYSPDILCGSPVYPIRILSFFTCKQPISTRKGELWLKLIWEWKDERTESINILNLTARLQLCEWTNGPFIWGSFTCQSSINHIKLQTCVFWLSNSHNLFFTCQYGFLQVNPPNEETHWNICAAAETGFP